MDRKQSVQYCPQHPPRLCHQHIQRLLHGQTDRSLIFWNNLSMETRLPNQEGEALGTDII
jgi:hypothetical protein